MQLVVHGVELLGAGEPHDAHGAVGLDANRLGKRVVHGSPLGARRTQVVGRPRIRVAMMFFWICEVPPITLWARL